MSDAKCKFCGLLDHKNDICDFRYDTKCPFGCATFGMSAEDLKNHRRDKWLYHLDVLMATVVDAGYARALKVEGDSGCSLGDSVMANLRLQVTKARELVENADYLRKKMTLKSRERREQMKLLEKAIDETTLISFNGTIVWIVPENMRELNIFSSPIFFTGKYGYKLRLKFLKKEANIEMYLIILKGLYDAVLSESFTTKLNIEYQEVGQSNKISKEIPMTLYRIMADEKIEEKEFRIHLLNCKKLEFIRCKVDCSELDNPSID